MWLEQVRRDGQRRGREQGRCDVGCCAAQLRRGVRLGGAGSAGTDEESRGVGGRERRGGVRRRGGQGGDAMQGGAERGRARRTGVHQEGCCVAQRAADTGGVERRGAARGVEERCV